MKIYNSQGAELLDIQVDDTSVRYRSIMQDDSLTLKFSHTTTVTVPAGSYVDFEGQRYTLWLPENFKKHNTRNFEYTITLGGWREALKLFKFKNLAAMPYRLKFSLTASPKDFLQLIVDNMNVGDSGWTAGSYVDAPEKTISFKHEYVFDVINRIAQEFTTEWEIENKTIHLRKVEKFKDDPLALSYGKGNGFKSGVGRANDGDNQPIGRLYVQGGERNIDFSTYGSTSLLLPKSATLVYDGKTFRSDAHGMYIARDGNNLLAEGSFDANHIYPKRVGTVSEVAVVDAEKHFYDIKDASIPASLDYSACRVDGEKATISFQSGALAGREFDIEQTDKALTGYIHAERRFKIVPQELDGIVMPGGAFVPAVGDKYAIFNISMPDSYIADNTTKTGASWEMFQECAKYFAENEKQKFNFTGELDGIWAKNKWLEIGGKIVPGGHVNFSDTQFLPNGEVVRIVSVKDYVNFPHKPEITLSNAPVSGGFNSTLGKLEAEEVVIEGNRKDGLLYSKRQWRDARETMALLEESLLKFSSGINPITVRTMQLLVGDESLQFRFVTNKTTPTQTSHNVTFDSGNKKLTAQAGIIQHMTLGINKISPTHKTSEYKYWDMAAYTSPALNADKPYYLFAKCSKTAGTGTFLLSDTAIELEAVAGFYHFMMGIVNSEVDNNRSIGMFYGFTEIMPGRITTDKIVSSDGKSYFDLLNGEIGGKMRFLNANNELEDVEKIKLYIQYSVDGASWHDVYVATDKFMRQKNGDSGTWSAAMPIAGKDGKDGYTPVKGTDYFDGEDGTNGVDGKSKYMYIRYSNTSDGTGFDTNPENKKYIGIAVTESSTPPSLKGGYNWTLVKGHDGVKGEDGEDGESRYLHIKYSNNGTTFTANNGETVGSWIGMYVDAVEADSNTFGAYTWNKIVGADGKDGKDGDDAFADPELMAKINQSAAVTDAMGTVIDGALISAVMLFLREAGSVLVTAGISGIQGMLKDNPAFWAGGAYAEAIAVTTFLKKIAAGTTPSAGEYFSLAKIALLHSGAAKVGDFLVEESGRIMLVDPTTGKPRLVFTAQNIPDLANLLNTTVASGSGNNSSTSTSWVYDPNALPSPFPYKKAVSLPNSVNVAQSNSTITFNTGNVSINAVASTSTLGSTAEAYVSLLRNGTHYAGLGSAFVTVNKDNRNGVASISIPNRVISGVPAGTYSLRLELRATDGIDSMNGSMGTSTIAWEFLQANVRYFQFGIDGMMAFFSDNHIHFTETSGWDVRGKTNMPGVLASGTVAANGGQSNTWGAKASTGGTSTVTGGRRVPLLNLEHDSYTVQITPHTSTSPFRVGAKTTTGFEALGTGAFDYTVIGRNY